MNDQEDLESTIFGNSGCDWRESRLIAEGILQSAWLAERDACIRAETESAALNLAANMIAKAPYPDWIVKAGIGNHPLVSAWLGGVQAAYNIVATMKSESDLKAIADQGADQ